jgi:dipeptidyl-peptidase 4
MRNGLPILSLILMLPLATGAGDALAQDRLPNMPRYDRYEKLRREIAGSVQRGEVRVNWADDGKTFTFTRDGKNYRYDVAAREAKEDTETGRQTTTRGQQRRAPERGRQFDTVYSADDKLKAFFRDRNVFLSDADGKNERQITTEGSVERRVKYGQASWVYGEELGVREAMWFSPDGKKLAFYRFDESKVPDYHLALDQTKFQTRLDAEAYPKAGADNPEVELYVYDLASGKTTKIDVTFRDPEVAHYVYSVRWSPKGDELLFNRTNRKQNIMEFCAANPTTGAARVVVREEQPNSWTDNSPPIQWLEDQHRFLWISERNGYRNFYLGDLGASPLRAITQHQFDVQSILRVDEKAGRIFYTARSGDNPYKHQLHRVGLDGRGDARLTDPKFHHQISLSPDGRHFVAVSENMQEPPVTRLHGEDGASLAVLAESDLTKFRELSLQVPERIVFKAADGKTDLYGYVMKPSDFDPNKKYPLLVSLYAGPESGSGSERFMTPNPITEMGFLVAWFDGRGTSGRGKAFKDEVYGKLGVVEIDDQAAGVKFLRERAYVDGGRVGVYGTSYGGYAAIMAILRHPDVFQAAVASASVTDWRHYDTIYTERYMGLPWDNENKAGYNEGSAITYVRNLKGRLMLFYGTADNNVHPANTLHLAQALQRAGKSFDMMAGPDQGHTGINQNMMWEYFVEHLILRSPKDQPLRVGWDMRKQRIASRAP